jgi:hypothetical protein
MDVGSDLFSFRSFIFLFLADSLPHVFFVNLLYNSQVPSFI